MSLPEATREVIEQLLDVVRSSADIYDRESELSMSSIGRHVRHVADHLLAYRRGFASGEIDYNVRRRDGAVERDAQLAVVELQQFIDWLEQTRPGPAPVRVLSEVAISHKECAVVQSTLERELVYLTNHTVHHLAFVTVLARSMGVELAAEVGLAPATLSWLRAQNADQTASG